MNNRFFCFMESSIWHAHKKLLPVEIGVKLILFHWNQKEILSVSEFLPCRTTSWMNCTLVDRLLKGQQTNAFWVLRLQVWNVIATQKSLPNQPYRWASLASKRRTQEYVGFISSSNGLWRLWICFLKLQNFFQGLYYPFSKRDCTDASITLMWHSDKVRLIYAPIRSLIRQSGSGDKVPCLSPKLRMIGTFYMPFKLSKFELCKYKKQKWRPTMSHEVMYLIFTKSETNYIFNFPPKISRMSEILV